MVLIWALDRLSRKGVEDTLTTLRQLYERGADVWSHTEDWLVTSTPAMRELLVSIFAWVAGQESQRRSERIKAGLARRKAEGKPVGGRKAGSSDRQPRSREGYVQRWAAERAGPGSEKVGHAGPVSRAHAVTTADPAADPEVLAEAPAVGDAGEVLASADYSEEIEDGPDGYAEDELDQEFGAE